MTKRREFSPSAHASKVYQRPSWKHATRWLAFLFVVVLDITLVASVFHLHFIKGVAATPSVIMREGLGFLLMILSNLFILPSIFLEINKVEVTPDRLILNNLLFRSKIKWEDIVAFTQPKVLKFAIVRTKRFVYLLNRHDLERYDEIAETIQHKTSNQPK